MLEPFVLFYLFYLYCKVDDGNQLEYQFYNVVASGHNVLPSIYMVDSSLSAPWYPMCESFLFVS